MNILKKIIIASIALSVYIVLGIETAQAAPPSQISTIPCPMPLPVGGVEGQTVECATLTVPENYAQPDGTQIELVYATLRAETLSPARDPVLYLHGGPGSAELTNLPLLAERFSAFLRTRDVIILDQRGAGFSSGPLDCATSLAANPAQVMTTITEGNAGGGVDDVTVVMDRLCADFVTARGADLTQYNTLNNARDVLALTAALVDAPDDSYDAINLYAWSYGTTLALETLRHLPNQDESPIRSVILDGVAPPDMKTQELSAQPRVEAAQALFDACAAQPACDAAYPDLINRFNALTARLDQQPMELPTGDVINAAALVRVFTLRNTPGADPAVSANLPRIIDELERGDTTTYVVWLNNELTPEEFPLEEGLPQPGNVSALVSAGDETAAQIAALQAQSDALLARLQHILAQAAQPLSLAVRFDRRATELLPQQADPAAAGAAYAAIPLQPATTATLTNFLAETLPGGDAELAMLAAQMSDADVAELLRLVAGSNRTQGFGTFVSTLVANRIFHCNDFYPFNTVEGQEAYARTALLPAMAAGITGVAADLAACERYGVLGGAPDSTFQPVTSAMPVLLLSGEDDTQTALSWARSARRTLSNSVAVDFPQSGHGVIQYSACAKDIAAAFFAAPTQEPVSTCVDALEIQFVVDAVNDGGE